MSKQTTNDSVNNSVNQPERKKDARCIACGGTLSELALFENMPASAQDIPDAQQLDEDHAVTLRLCQCADCGLVQFDTKPVYYYKDVIRAGGGSSTMRKLRHEEYGRLLAWMDRKHIAGRNIVEVGCGRGEFLKMWADLPEVQPQQGSAVQIQCAAENTESAEKGRCCGEARMPQVSGIEHKVELVGLAQADGLSVTQGFAEGDFRMPGAPFDAFVQFNFLEHQPHPADMLHCIRKNLKPGALGLVTVPDLGYILENDGYYELIRDHIAYYTQDTLAALMERCGFRVLASRIVNRDTIEVIVENTGADAEKSGQETGVKISAACDTDARTGTLDVSALVDNFKELDADINAHLKRLEAEGRTLAIWGASHQGFTLAATTKLGGKVRYIIDSAPFKQGRFAPASHIPIVAPAHFTEEPVDEILIVAPGYTDEIAEIIRTNFGGKVRILALRSRKIAEIS